jgi:biopolymer transport protein ExbB/TolQ
VGRAGPKPGGDVRGWPLSRKLPSTNDSALQDVAFAKIWVQNQDVREQPPTNASSIQFARRAAERTAAVVHGELNRGLSGLATVAAVAPWVGLLGTVAGVVRSLNQGVAGNQASFLGAIANRLSAACMLAAFGLLVGLTSLWCYRYLASRLEVFDREMDGACLQLGKSVERWARSGPEGPPA